MKAILKKCLCLVLTAGLLASLAACAGPIGSALDTGIVCVFGPRTQLEACGDLSIQEL